MKQLSEFLAKIRGAGMDYHVNWSIALQGGDRLYNYTFKFSSIL